MADRCDGNFLVACCLLDTIAAGVIGFDKVAELPIQGIQSLPTILERTFSWRFPMTTADNRRIWQLVQCLLEVIAAAQLSGEQAHERELFAAMLALSPDNTQKEASVTQALGFLRGFCTVSYGQFAIHHGSLLDWLTDSKAQHDYSLDLRHGHRRLCILDTLALIIQKPAAVQLDLVSTYLLLKTDALRYCRANGRQILFRLRRYSDLARRNAGTFSTMSIADRA